MGWLGEVNVFFVDLGGGYDLWHLGDGGDVEDCVEEGVVDRGEVVEGRVD